MMFGKKKKPMQQRSVVNKKFGLELDFASAEAYNLLRTNISFALPGKQGCKMIGITSPCPQEGKSFTSINLSYSLGKNGSKVLLIDGDMRRPSISSTLRLKRSPGLSNVLTRQNSDDQVLHKGALHENVDVLLSGDIPPNPSELLGSDEMRLLLEKVAPNYDYIILDLPPVISVSDALVISKFIDGVIVVLRHGLTRRRNVQETVRQLRFADSHILGFVYNGYRTGGGYYRPGRKYYKYDRYYKHYYASSALQKSDDVEPSVDSDQNLKEHEERE